MSLDPSALLALATQLVDKCDGGQFALTVDPAARDRLSVRPYEGAVPFAAVFAPAPGEPAVAVTYAATYKGQRYTETCITSAAHVDHVRAAMLGRALDILGLVDVRRAGFGITDKPNDPVPEPAPPAWLRR